MSLTDRIEEARKRIKILVKGEEAPPAPPGPRSAAAVRRPIPPPKEPPLSPRRLFIVLEVALLFWACWLLPRTWRVMLGGWPSRANFFAPRIESFDFVRGLAVDGRDLWVTGPADLVLVHEGARMRPFERVRRRLPSRTVTAVLPGPGLTWIGTGRGLAVRDRKGAAKVPGRGGPGRVHVTSLARDSRGRIWAGTAKDGLFVLDGKAWKNYRSELASPYVTALAAGEGGAVWVGLYSGGVVRTDGAKWTVCREPEALRGHPVRRLVASGKDGVLGMTDRGLAVVTTTSWREVEPKGIPSGERPADLVAFEGGRVVIVTTKGRMLDLDRSFANVREVLPGHAVTAVAGDARALYFGEAGTVWRMLPGLVEPLTNWGSYFSPSGWFPPAPDFPADWRDPRYRRTAGRLAASAILLAFALLTRAARWARTPGNHAWRIGPLRTAFAGIAILAGYYLGQSLSWKDRPFIATTANELVLYPAVLLVLGWSFLHWIRIIRFEWQLRRDAFWTGTALVLSGTGAWLWWVNGALVPSLVVCSVGGLVFARSLKGLQTGTWTGMSLAWGIVVLLFQQAALFPPLVFATMTWGKAAIAMPGTNPVSSGMRAAPEWLEWSPDGLRELFVVPAATGGGGIVELVDANVLGWKKKGYPVPTVETTPRFSPDSTRVAMCLPEGRDTVVECIGVDGERRWRSRLQGMRVAGNQPWWEPSGSSMLVLTSIPGGTQVWRVSAAKGDAVRLASVPWKLSWPALSGDGSRLVCAVSRGAEARMVSIDLADRKPLLITPAPPKRELPFVYSPSEEGKSILSFLERLKDMVRGMLERVRGTTQRVAGFFGYRPQIPELWLKKPLWTPAPPKPGFRWADYEMVREVAVSVDGGKIVCVARRSRGTDELLLMNADGTDLVRIFRSRGILHSLRWAALKNRMAVVEERMSALAPFPVRSLLMVTGLPGKAEVKGFVPYAHWVSAPAFSVDGQRIDYAAPDRFWKASLTPPDSFGFYEVSLESEIGAFTRRQSEMEQAL